jgi:tRNA threonylcarbamoyladenosine biosynthesis protein TsaE
VRAFFKLLPKKKAASVVYLNGELGAGKTTFVQELAREYGIEGVVQSPTYVLMRSYDIPGTGRTNFGMPRRYERIVHIDAYRLEKPEEFAALRPEEFLNDPHTLVLVEWPERAEGLLPAPDIVLNFSSSGMGESERIIEMETS